VEELNPIQERRRKYESDPKMVWDILEAGSQRAAIAAERTMTDVRASMQMSKQYEPRPEMAKANG
jgi:tryptophanyl-tRNA synthetase